MNKKIVSMYLKMVMTAVITTLIIGGLVSYFLLFDGKSSDQYSPENLAITASGYIKINNDDIVVNEGFKRILDEGEVWLQVLDKEGKCVYDYNVPADVPSKYSMLELVEYCMKSDELSGYTLFYLQLDDNKDYGVVTGCSSDKVKKILYTYDATTNNDWLSVVVILMLTAIIVVVISSFIFSRRISRPVTDIIENINEIAYGKYIEKEQKSSLFKDVFVKLKKLHGTLKQNEKMREEWIANISHDLKSPLVTIKGYAEILENPKYETSKDEMRVYASEIHKAEENMYSLIEDLKMSQKLKEGKIILNKGNNDIIEILQCCMDELDASIIRKSKVIFNNEQKVIVNCDRELIKRCLQNIICNAFVHNKDDITLTIEVNENEKNAEIIIEDNGRGMSEIDRSRIFERYYRGINSQSTNGTGLGLAIAKEVIVAHGGTIEVESTEGKGTKFKIIL